MDEQYSLQVEPLLLREAEREQFRRLVWRVIEAIGQAIKREETPDIAAIIEDEEAFKKHQG